MDFDEDTLEYELRIGNEVAKGEVSSFEEFNSACQRILGLYKTDRIEVALKFFKQKNTRIYGICPKSFPKTELTSELIGLINLCTGGSSGLELIHLPYEGTILDQPNIFIESYYIYLDEYNKFMQLVRKNEKHKNAADR